MFSISYKKPSVKEGPMFSSHALKYLDRNIQGVCNVAKPHTNSRKVIMTSGGQEW